MKARLTERQNQAFEFIRDYVRTHRKPPTLVEIGEALGIRSTNGVHKLVTALETKGYLEREPHAARGLRLADDADDAFSLDTGTPNLMLVSRTSSAAPERLRARPAGFLPVAPYLLKAARDEDACLLALAGDDGMNGEGIRKGDILVVEECPWEDLRNGDLAAVLVREELQARRFFHVNGRHHLRPADRTYTEETFPPQDPACFVVGRVLALMRRY